MDVGNELKKIEDKRDAAERHWKELPRHKQSLSPDTESYRERFPPPMTLSCHSCDVSRYGTYVACLTMSIAMIK